MENLLHNLKIRIGQTEESVKLNRGQLRLPNLQNRKKKEGRKINRLSETYKAP